MHEEGLEDSVGFEFLCILIADLECWILQVWVTEESIRGGRCRLVVLHGFLRRWSLVLAHFKFSIINQKVIEHEKGGRVDRTATVLERSKVVLKAAIVKSFSNNSVLY